MPSQAPARRFRNATHEQVARVSRALASPQRHRELVRERILRQLPRQRGAQGLGRSAPSQRRADARPARAPRDPRRSVLPAHGGCLARSRGGTAQSKARLSGELRARPLLRAAVRAGDYVRLRNALTVLPVAIGDAEAAWTERARTETVRALEKAVRSAQHGDVGEADEWARLRVRLSPEDRATVDEALAIAGRLMPGSTRPQPGCSRRAVHAHHVDPCCRGGADTEDNLVALCACHHLLGIHGGFIRVRGRAPDRLTWELAGDPLGEGSFGRSGPAAGAVVVSAEAAR